VGGVVTGGGEDEVVAAEEVLAPVVADDAGPVFPWLDNVSPTMAPPTTISATTATRSLRCLNRPGRLPRLRWVSVDVLNDVGDEACAISVLRSLTTGDELASLGSRS
jgi:hypothetical protein